MLYESDTVDVLARRAALHFVAAGRAPHPSQRSEHRRKALKLADRLRAHQLSLQAPS